MREAWETPHSEQDTLISPCLPFMCVVASSAVLGLSGSERLRLACGAQKAGCLFIMRGRTALEEASLLVILIWKSFRGGVHTEYQELWYLGNEKKNIPRSSRKHIYFHSLSAGHTGKGKTVIHVYDVDLGALETSTLLCYPLHALGCQGS